MLKIGIVGAGIFGKAHAEVIKNNKDCCLVSVCDTLEEKANELAQRYDAKPFTDYKEMCEMMELDAVILNLPHFLHCEVAIYFLERKVNVLVEKPMAITTEECDAMNEAAKKSGAKLAIGHVQRYFSVYDEIKNILETENYGKLCMITEVRNCDYIKNRPKWFLNKKLSGGGILMNFGPHTLDKIMYVTGDYVVEEKAILANPFATETEDAAINVQLLLKLAGGTSVTVTYCGCPGVYFYETAFYFEQGVVKTDGANLYLSEEGKFTHSMGETDFLDKQLCEFVKFLKDEPSKVVTYEYAREIVRVLEKVLND